MRSCFKTVVLKTGKSTSRSLVHDPTYTCKNGRYTLQLYVEFRHEYVADIHYNYTLYLMHVYWRIYTYTSSLKCMYMCDNLHVYVQMTVLYVRNYTFFRCAYTRKILYIYVQNLRVYAIASIRFFRLKTFQLMETKAWMNGLELSRIYADYSPFPIQCVTTSR